MEIPLKHILSFYGFSTCRLFILTMKIPTRVDQHFHFLDIQTIESKKNNQLCLTVYDKKHVFYSLDDTDSIHHVDSIIFHLSSTLLNIFPSVPLRHIIKKIDLSPANRMQRLEELEENSQISAKNASPCGAFSDQYACMCDYHGLPYRPEVAWDVDTIYLSHDIRELYLHDFDYLDQKDLIPIISALELNTWFMRLKASHSKLSHEAVERILHVVSKSLALKEIYLDNIGAKVEFANKFSQALLSNNQIPLQKLDLSNNPIEDKGAVHLSNPIGRQSKGLTHLNLSHCNLSSKGVNMIAHSLSVNKHMCQTLTLLSLSGNNLRDEVNNLYNFLAQPNVLKSLDLSNTECAIDAIFGALLRGCTTHLSSLNVSRNVVSSKKNREMFPSFKQYFTSTIALRDLNISHCKLSADALKNVLLGLACNENISDVKVDLSSNQLGHTGAQILESCLHGIRCLVTLDISENSLENQLGSVVTSASRNKSLKSLNISRNLNTIKSKHVAHVVDAIVQLLQEEDSVLETLIANDLKLKHDIHNLLNAIGSNRCLLSLDICGNYMGDAGARLLAKALQINSKLEHLSYDRNNVTLMGYSDVAYALQNNYAMKFMPFPVHDATACMKSAPDRTEAVMSRIQVSLFRNISPRKLAMNGQAFRLQQGFILSSTQQQLDRLVLQTSEVARTLKRTATTGQASAPFGDSHIKSMIKCSDALISDAENSKQLISHFHHDLRSGANPIQTKLNQLSNELHSVIQTYIQDTVEHMLRSAQERCPNVLSNEKVIDEIRHICISKAKVSKSLIDEAIVDEAGSVILNKVNEANLLTASAVSDKVIDEVVNALSTNCHSLQSGEEPRRRTMTSYDANRRSYDSTRSDKSYRNDRDADGARSSSDVSPVATPMFSKRKHLHIRKLRPQSVVEKNNNRTQEEQKSDALLTRSASHERTLVSISRQQNSDDQTLVSLSSIGLDSNDNSSLDGAESLDSVSELPSTSTQLQHFGKGRPRRTKTRAPTRAMGRVQTLEEDHDISQGVDTFFSQTSVGCPSNTPILMSPLSEHNNSRGSKRSSISSGESSPAIGNRFSSVESLSRSESESKTSPKNRSFKLSNLNTESKNKSFKFSNSSNETPTRPFSASFNVSKLINDSETKTSRVSNLNTELATTAKNSIVCNLSSETTKSKSFKFSHLNNEKTTTKLSNLKNDFAANNFKVSNSNGMSTQENETKTAETAAKKNIKEIIDGKCAEKNNFKPIKKTSFSDKDTKIFTEKTSKASKEIIGEKNSSSCTEHLNFSRSSLNNSSINSFNSAKLDGNIFVKLKSTAPNVKPRPKSFFVSTSEMDDLNDGKKNDETQEQRSFSVKEMAASLAEKCVSKSPTSPSESDKKKSASLPRNSLPKVVGT